MTTPKLTPEQQKQLEEAIRRLTPQQQRQLAVGITGALAERLGVPLPPDINREYQSIMSSVQQQLQQQPQVSSSGIPRPQTSISSSSEQQQTQGISSSFSIGNITSIANELKKSLGMEKLIGDYEQTISETRRLLEQYKQSVQSAKQTLLAEKQTALEEAQETLERQNRAIQAALGVQIGIGSGYLDEVLELQRRNRQAIDKLALQYDTAIANFDFQTAEQILSHQLSLMNFQNQLNTMTHNAMSQLIPMASNLILAQKEQEERERVSSLQDLQNILNLYSGKTVKWENLSPTTRRRLESLSQKTQIPLETIKSYLSTPELKSVQIVGNKLIKIYSGGQTEWETIPGLTETRTSGKGLVSEIDRDLQETIISNYLSGVFERKSGTQDERMVIGAFRNLIERQAETNPILKLTWEVRANFEKFQEAGDKSPESKLGLSTFSTSFGTFGLMQSRDPYVKYNELIGKTAGIIKNKFSRTPNLYNQVLEMSSKEFGISLSKNISRMSEREKDELLKTIVKEYFEQLIPFDYAMRALTP